MNALLFLVFVILTSSFSVAYKVVRFSGGGIYFWWQAGAARYLMENCDLNALPVMGASAGSITATLLALNVSFDKVAEIAIRIGDDLKVWERKSGFAGIWGDVVKQFLEEIIPENLDRNALARINVLVTPRYLVGGPKLLSKFINKADLVEAIMASIHIPIFMNGKLWTSYQGKMYIDGSFWSLLANIKGPWPDGQYIDKHVDVLNVDYKLDSEFRSSQKLSIVTMIKPDDMYDMMRSGYNFMEKQDKSGLLCTCSLRSTLIEETPYEAGFIET